MRGGREKESSGTKWRWPRHGRAACRHRSTAVLLLLLLMLMLLRMWLMLLPCRVGLGRLGPEQGVVARRGVEGKEQRVRQQR